MFVSSFWLPYLVIIQVTRSADQIFSMFYKNLLSDCSVLLETEGWGACGKEFKGPRGCVSQLFLWPSLGTWMVLTFSLVSVDVEMCWMLIHCCSVAQLFLTLASHGPQHARLPSPSSSDRTCSNSCLLSQGCHPTISSSVFSFSSCLQSFPASGLF